MNPQFWISLHDMTPAVFCKHQVVYCHNPAIFYNLTLKDAWTEKSLFFFSMFYGLFYRININRNKWIIVQQQWLRDEFAKRYSVSPKNIIVAHPEVHLQSPVPDDNAHNIKYTFFYPSFPRVFKNFDTLLRAAEYLAHNRNDFQVIITIKGTENKYASGLAKKFSHLQCIQFIGLQTRENMWKLYSDADCLVFASTLETWGLPITEMKYFNKPMLVAHARYSTETVGDYDKCCFFNPCDYRHLAALMNQAINHELTFDVTRKIFPEQPFAQTWKELYQLILS